VLALIIQIAGLLARLKAAMVFSICPVLWEIPTCMARMRMETIAGGRISYVKYFSAIAIFIFVIALYQLY